jgi:hypothetical protein
MLLLALFALAISVVPLLLLCINDPKRRRATGCKGGMSNGLRHVTVIVACLPSVALALMGNAGGFMLWLGGCALWGWAVATFAPLADRYR